MKIATEQINLANALRAVADGGQVQAIWVDDDGTINFYSLNRNISDITKIADAFLLVAEAEPVDTVDEPVEKTGVSAGDIADITPTHENVIDTCETAAPEVVVTDPDTTPITVAIPNSQMSKKIARWNLNDDEILRLRKDGLTERQIADRLDVTQTTVHNHVQKMKREGRL